MSSIQATVRASGIHQALKVNSHVPSEHGNSVSQSIYKVQVTILNSSWRSLALYRFHCRKLSKSPSAAVLHYPRVQALKVASVTPRAMSGKRRLRGGSRRGTLPDAFCFRVRKIAEPSTDQAPIA